MRHGAVFAQIDVPLEGLPREVVLLDALEQQLRIVDALAAADDFPVAFGREHVHAQHQVRPLGVRLEIKRLERSREAVHHDGPLAVFREQRLVGAAKIAAPLDLAAPRLQNPDGVVVAHPRKRRLDGFQLGDVALQPLQLLAPVFEHAPDDEDDQLLGHALHVLQRGVGHLRLYHPELREVAPRLGFLGAEGRSKAVDLAEGHGRGFVIELAGLRQVGLVVLEVVHLEQRGGSLARCRSENRGIHQGEAVRVEIVAHCFDYFVAHANDGVLALAAQPQVAVVHQKVGAMLLGRDRIRVAFRHALHHFQVLQVHLEAAGRALVGADLASDDNGGFLGQVLDGLEQFFRQGGLHGHALHQAVAVAKDRERDLSGAAQVVQPAGNLHAFAGVLGGFGDGDSWNHNLLFLWGGPPGPGSPLGTTPSSACPVEESRPGGRLRTRGSAQ